MKINEEYYIKFIKICTKSKLDNVVSSNQLYNFFCAIFDIDTTHFSIKTFIPKFLKVYESLTGIKLEKVKKRVSLRANTMRGIKGIIIDRLIIESNNDVLSMTTAMTEPHIIQTPLIEGNFKNDASATSNEMHQQRITRVDWEALNPIIKNWLLKKYKPADLTSNCLISEMLEDFALYSKITNLNNTGGRFTNRILIILKEIFPDHEIKRSLIKKRQNKTQISIPIIIGLKKI